MITGVGIAIILIALITFIKIIHIMMSQGAGRNPGRRDGSDSSSYSPVGFGDGGGGGFGGFGGDGGGSCGDGGGGGGSC